MLDPTALPEEIRDTERAVVWKREERDGKATKVPYRPGRPSEYAKVSDAETWGAFEDALRNVEDGKVDGAGFVLGDGIVGVDLDGCRDPDTGELEPWARKIVDRLDSYTEVSPSGTGVHIIARGALPDGRRRKGPVEMYSDGRYFTVTGGHLEETPQEIRERTAELAALHAATFETNGDGGDAGRDPGQPVASDLNLSDRELIEKAKSAKNGDRFARLWAGDTSEHPSQSEADLALVNLLAFWTRGDADRIDSLFRQSGLMRDKWKREDYRDRTIGRALEGRTEFYEPEVGDRADALLRGEPDPAPSEGELVRPQHRELIDAADLLSDPENLRVPDPILPGIAWPRELTLLTGRPKVAGKTSLLTAGCYAVATGSRFLGEQAKSGRALWVMAEGSDRHIGRYLAQLDVELPRGRFKIVRPGVEPFENLRRDLEEFDADLVVVDSLSPWLAPLDVDLYKDEVVGPLTEVYRIADDGPAVVLIHHPRKADDDPAGSHKLKAIPDVVRTLKEGESDRERVIEGVGRWSLETIRYRQDRVGDHDEVPNLETVRFSVVDPNRPVTVKILDYLDHEPGASKSQIRANVNARATAVDAGLEELEEAGKVVVDRSGRSHSYSVAQDPHGHATDTDGHGAGHGDSGRCSETVSEGALSSLEESPRTLEDAPADEEVGEDDLPF